MKKRAKILLALVCALALMAGSAVAATVITTKTIQAQFMGIQTVVNGVPVTLKGAGGQAVEPFLYNGDTYVPIRALGEAMGKSVEWDNSTKTLYVGGTPLQEDAEQLISLIEKTHPAFALDKVPAGYSAAKAALAALAAEPKTSVYEFTFAAMAYLATLEDGHTAIDPFGNTPQATLDIQWVADGERLFLLDGKGAITKQEVVKIGGAAVADVFEIIDQYIASENSSGSALHHAEWSKYPAMLVPAGTQLADNGDVVVTVKDSGGEKKQTVSLAMPADTAPDSVISTKKMGDVFYVDFNMCSPGAAMDAAVEQLAAAVKGGTTKVIIDVRGNGGGDSRTCEQLLDAMGMAAPQYGVYLRYSPLAHATYPDQYSESEGSFTYDPHPETAKANPAIKLVVLTDEDTFSSATMLGVFVRDGKLGTIIGRASANAPNSYGDILRYTLENTGLSGTISHKQWLRPDQSAAGNALIPDLETAVGEDSLQVALDYLNA